MITYALYDNSGKIVSRNLSQTLDEASYAATSQELNLWLGIVPDPNMYYIDVEAEMFVLRPILSLPNVKELLAGTEWTLNDIPIGTSVVVDGNVMDPSPIVTLGVTLRPTSAGVFSIVMRPPWPYHEASCTLTVIE